MLYEYAKTFSLFFVEVSLHDSTALFMIQCGKLVKDLLPSAWWDEFSGDLWSWVKTIIFGPPDDIVAESEGASMFGTFVEKLVSAKQNVVDFGDSVIYRRFMRFMTSVLGCAVAAKMGLVSKLQWCLPKGYEVPTGEVTAQDLILNLVSSTIDIIESGYQQYVLGHTVTSHTGKHYRDWLRRKVDLENRFSTYAANAQSTNYEALCDELVELYNTGREMVNTTRNYHPRLLNLVTKEWNVLKDLYTQHIVMGNCGSRKAPISFRVVGPPGVGKSGMATSLFTLGSQVCGLSPSFKPGDEFILSPTSQFMDGVEGKTNGYWLIDDAGQWKCQGGDPPEDLKQVILCSNTQTYPLNMAYAKGKYHGAPQMLVVTSNKFDLGASDYFSTPSAVARRFNATVVTTVKEEYQRVEDGKLTGRLDHTKLTGDENDLEHLHVEIYRSVLEPRKNTVHNDYNSNVYEKLVYSGPWWPEDAESEGATTVLATIMKDFRESQEKFRRAQQKKSSLRYSPDGRPIEAEKLNPQPEGLDMVVAPWWFTALVILMSLVGLDRFINFSQVPSRLSSLRNAVMADVTLVREASAQVAKVAEDTAQAFDVKLRAFMALGDSIENSILSATSDLFRNFRNVILAIGGTAVLYQLLNLMKPPAIRPEGNATTRGREPQKVSAVATRRPNYYDYMVQRVESAVFSQQTENSTYAEVLPHIRSAVCRVQLYVKGHALNTTCFCLSGVDYAFATHTIKFFLGQPDSIRVTFLSEGTTRKDFVVMVDPRNHASESELTVLRIPGKLKKRSITKFLIQEHGTARMPGHLLTSTNEVPIVASHYPSISYVDKSGFRWEIDDILKYDHSEKGECGSPLVFRVQRPSGTSGLAIAGIHIAGDQERNAGFSLPLTYDVVKGLIGRIDHLSPFPSVVFKNEADLTMVAGRQEVGEMQVEPEGVEFIFETPVLKVPHPKNTAYYLSDCGAMDVLGELPVHTGRSATDVRKSLIHDDVERVLGPTEYTRPLMNKGWVGEGDQRFYNNPHLVALEQISSYPVLVDPQEVDQCVESYLTRVMSLLPDGAFDNMEVLSDAEALNGLPGEHYIKGVKRKTAGGYGLFQSKTKAGCYEPDPSPRYPDGIKMSPGMQYWTDDIWDTLSSEAIGSVFQAHLKNEPRVKYSDGRVKTARLFTGTPAAWSHCVRRLFLPVISLIQTYGLVFETAVGVNAASYDWSILRDHITRYGEGRIVEGDFSKFDKYNCCYVVLSAFRILIHLMKAAGYSDRDLSRAWNVSYDSASPTILLDRTLYVLYASFPSGHPATVIINSISNSLYIRLCWLRAGFPLADFDKSVSFLSYGDDNIFSVREGVDFGFSRVASLMADFGMVYTLPDKSLEERDFTHVDTCSFLKRGFRCADGKVYAPLDVSSLRRRLMLTYDSTLSEEEQARVVLLDSLADSWHHGARVYELYRNLALDLFHKYCLGTPDEVPSFESFTAIMEKNYTPEAARVIPV
jgi:hypothetical protein